MRESFLVKRSTAAAPVSPPAARMVVGIVLSEIGSPSTGSEGLDSRVRHLYANLADRAHSDNPPQQCTHRDTGLRFRVIQGVEEFQGSGGLSGGESLPIKNGKCVLVRRWSELIGRGRCDDDG